MLCIYRFRVRTTDYENMTNLIRLSSAEVCQALYPHHATFGASHFRALLDNAFLASERLNDTDTEATIILDSCAAITQFLLEIARNETLQKQILKKYPLDFLGKRRILRILSRINLGRDAGTLKDFYIKEA